MTLTRLVLAWAPVALWFLAVDAGRRRWLAAAPAPPPAPPPALPPPVAPPSPPPRPPLWARFGEPRSLVEAGITTLLGSLWFDSLGHGGWWLVFLLVGLLAASLPRRPGLGPVLIDAARYVVAGAILAWRLG